MITAKMTAALPRISLTELLVSLVLKVFYGVLYEEKFCVLCSDKYRVQPLP